MKRAVLAIAAAFAVSFGAAAALAQENAPPPPQQQLPDLELSAPAKGKAKSQAQMDAEAMARAPQLVAAAKVVCTPTAARNAGSYNQTNSAGKKANFDAIELACSEGPGYMMAAFEKNGPVGGQDCIAQYSSAKGPTDPLICKLPGNTPPQKFLQPALTQISSPCQPTDVRMLGTTTTSKVYELACASGMGVVLSVPTDPAAKPQTMSCLSASGNMACKLTTPATIETTIKALVAKADAKCTLEKQRYVMTVVDGDVIEVSCAGGSGMMLVAKGGAELVNSVPCARAGGYQGGCQLSDVKAAQTAEAGNYTQFARKAGFDCDVSQYGVFPTSGGGKEIVELACKNRPDGAVAIFSGDGKDQILNCNRAAIEGFRCTYSKADANFAQINDQLKAAGKGSCVANAARGIGVNTKSAYLEIACADGNPGWVMVYPRGIADPSDIMSCGAAKASGVGACDLPSNKKAAIG